MEKSKTWNSYFGNIRKKYDMSVSAEKPLVIFLDGKGISAGKEYNLLGNYENSFTNIMEKTVRDFTKTYNCLAIFGMDEVSFIFEKAELIIDKINKDKNFKTNEITSIFSQYFFEYFNKLNKNGNAVYWHARCHSIPEGKINSYVKYRSGGIFNTYTTYFLKKENIKNSGKIRLKDRIKLCEDIKNYSEIKEFEKGILYYKGNKIDLNQFFEGNIVIVESKPSANTEYVDLATFDKLL